MSDIQSLEVRIIKLEKRIQEFETELGTTKSVLKSFLRKQ